MKWPRTLILATPGESISQARKRRLLLNDQDFLDLLKYLNEDPDSLLIDGLAQTIKERLGLPTSDLISPLTPEGREQVRLTTLKLREIMDCPERIFVAPCAMALETAAVIQKHWPAAKNTPITKDERLKAQDLGLAALYHDPRIFMILNPEQKEMIGLYGPYRYRFPQGESIADARERTRGGNRRLGPRTRWQPYPGNSAVTDQSLPGSQFSRRHS